MGECGETQAARSDFPFGSHGLCPYFYNYAFENRFYAIEKPDICPEGTRDYVPAKGSNLPYMGYQILPSCSSR